MYKAGKMNMDMDMNMDMSMNMKSRELEEWDYSEVGSDTSFLVGPTHETHENEKTKNGVLLRYSKIEDISFCFYCLESVSYVGNYLVERVPFLITYILYNLAGDSYSTEVTGFVFQYVTILSSLSHDFQEPIGIILGPYYSKKDAPNYTRFFYRLLSMQIVVWLLSMCFVLCIGGFYRSINVLESKIEDYTYYSYWMFFLLNTTSTVVSYLRGNQAIPILDFRLFIILHFSQKPFSYNFH